MGLRHLIDRQQIPQMRRCQFHAYHTLFIGIFILSGTGSALPESSRDVIQSYLLFF